MLTLNYSTHSELLKAKVGEEYNDLCKGQHSMQTWVILLTVFVLRCSSFHLRLNVFSSFTHKYMVFLKVLLGEIGKIRFITNIFSSSKQSRMGGWTIVLAGDLLRASQKVHALKLKGWWCYRICDWGIEVDFNWMWGQEGKRCPSWTCFSSPILHNTHTPLHILTGE